MDQTTTAGLFLPYQYGRGYPTLNKGLTPAAATASVLPVPGGRNFRLLAVTAALATSAVAGNRGVFLEFLDADGSVYCHIPQTVAVAVGTTVSFTFAGRQGLNVAGADGSLLAPVPELILPVGHKARINWSAQDAGDALKNVFWYYDEFVIGADGYTQGATEAHQPHLNP